MGSGTSNSGSKQLVAFFRDREDAYEAIDSLRSAGFTNNEIGLAFQGQDDASTQSRAVGGVSDDKSTWQKVKDFFVGGDDEDTDTAYNSGDADDSYRHFNFSDEQWNYYRSGMGQGGAIVTVRAVAGRLDEARGILQDNDADFRPTGFEPSKFKDNAAEQGQSMQLRGEMLQTYKDRVSKGEVRLRKEVVSENRTIDVPVTREEVVIERVGAGEAGNISGNVGEIGAGEEVRIPVSEERVRVEKQGVVTGGVRVAKRAVQGTERVSETLRNEEVRVEKEGDINVEDTGSTTKRKKPAA